MKKLIVSLSTLTAFLVLFLCIVLPTQAETYNGTCGDNLTWTFDPDSGTLTIDGEGEMDDYSWYDTSLPWYDFKTKITTVVISDKVTSIGSSAFYGCSSLASINIPDGVTNIGNSAFYGCSSLASINIPDGVTNIGNSAFYGCSSLTSINIPDGVTSIGSSAFSGCSSLTSINIPDGVTSIDWHAFSGCSSLTSINIPDGVTNIGVSAFSGCSSLTSINIPNGVTSIGRSAFSGCSSLTSINIPDGVTSIGDDAFGTDIYHKLDIIYCGTEEEWNSIEKGNNYLPFNYTLSYHKYSWTAQEGKHLGTCIYCGGTCEDLTHQYDKWEKYDDKQHKHTCQLEGCEYTEYADHNWNNGVITKKATHLSEGEKTYTCYGCGATKIEVIPKNDNHSYGNWEKYDETQHKHTCECGKIEYADHVYVDGLWGEPIYDVISEPTHTQEGKYIYYCVDCGAEKVVIIPKLEKHTYGKWEKYSDTQHKHTCECGDIKYADHNWDNGVVTQKATHLVEGVRTYTCKD